MKVRNLIMDTSDLSIEEMDTLIKELKRACARKVKAQERHEDLCSLVGTMREENMVFCSKHTGEILNPNDWVVYDNLTHEGYPQSVDD